MIIEVTKLVNLKRLGVMIQDESKKQIEKWGIQRKPIFEWFMWLAEEFGEFAQAINEAVYRNGSIENVITEGVQVATLTIKMIDGVLKSIES